MKAINRWISAKSAGLSIGERGGFDDPPFDFAAPSPLSSNVEHIIDRAPPPPPPASLSSSSSLFLLPLFKGTGWWFLVGDPRGVSALLSRWKPSSKDEEGCLFIRGRIVGWELLERYEVYSRNRKKAYYYIDTLHFVQVSFFLIGRRLYESYRIIYR